MSEAGRRIVDTLCEIPGDVTTVSIDGVRWVRAPEWKLIRTAPKDGSCILVTDSHRQDTWHIVSWEDDYESGYCWKASEFTAYRVDAFTHWMLLPSPPVQS